MGCQSSKHSERVSSSANAREGRVVGSDLDSVHGMLAKEAKKDISELKGYVARPAHPLLDGDGQKSVEGGDNRPDKDIVTGSTVSSGSSAEPTAAASSASPTPSQWKLQFQQGRQASADLEALLFHSSHHNNVHFDPRGVGGGKNNSAGSFRSSDLSAPSSNSEKVLCQLGWCSA